MKLPWKRREMTAEEVRQLTQKAFSEIVKSMRAMLGDAENYVEMAFVCDITLEKFVVRIQRADRITPHDARVAAEQERDRALEEARRLRVEVANLRAQIGKGEA